MDGSPTRLLCPWNFPGKNTGVGCIPFSGGSSQPRDWTQVSCLAGRSFAIEPPREPLQDGSWGQKPGLCGQDPRFRLWPSYTCLGDPSPFTSPLLPAYIPLKTVSWSKLTLTGHSFSQRHSPSHSRILTDPCPLPSSHYFIIHSFFHSFTSIYWTSSMTRLSSKYWGCISERNKQGLS